MRNLITIIFTLIILIAIFSCSQGYIVNTNAYTSYPEGRNLYMAKCGGCHKLFDPNDYTRGEWDKIIIAMQEKSKIDDQQKNDILDWIIETGQSLENVKLKNKL